MSAPRTTSGPAPDPVRPSRARGLWVVIGLLLAPAVVLPLLVPLYDRTDPTFLGFPFYYWFQFAMIPLAAVLTVTAYVLSRRADRIRREERRAGR